MVNYFHICVSIHNVGGTYRSYVIFWFSLISFSYIELFIIAFNLKFQNTNESMHIMTYTI